MYVFSKKIVILGFDTFKKNTMCSKIRIGITQGDTSGIGLECALKALADPRILEILTPVLYASESAVEHYRKLVEDGESMNIRKVADADKAQDGQINLVAVGNPSAITPGQGSAESGKAAIDALRKAVEDAKNDLIDGLVTMPICKENTKSESFPYAGHTGYLGDEFEGVPTMMMISDTMRVALQTTHIPLGEVRQYLSIESISTKLAELRESLISDFGIVEPRIAVLSLNPHSGEGGVLGSEEIQIITPAIQAAAEERIYAFGPFAADGLFLSGAFAKYDALLAMYHDQGLIPFKALTPDGVNYTAGLSVVRTSPDHGTAYDIAGKGVADAQATRNALYAAVDIIRNRERRAEMTANPLPHYEREKGRDISISELKLPEQHD